MKRLLFLLLFISLVSAIFAEETIDDKKAKLMEAARKYVKSQQSPISHSKETTQLIEAVKEGNLPSVKTSLANGADIKVKNRKGDTLLFLAIEKGHTEIVGFLLDNGFGINDEDPIGRTTLLAAAYCGHTEIVKLLLDKGAEVNPKNDYGFTPLMAAADNGYLEIVKLLLDKGADVNTKHKTGNTALIGAAERGFPRTGLFPKKRTEVNPQEQNNRMEIVKLLLDKGAEVNAKNENGYTALIAAAEFGRTEIVKLLLDRGADINARTNEGLTAIEQAKRASRTDTVQFLQKAGAKVGIQYYLMLGHKFLENPNMFSLVILTMVLIATGLLRLLFKYFKLLWRSSLIAYVIFSVYLVLVDSPHLLDNAIIHTIVTIFSVLLTPAIIAVAMFKRMGPCPTNSDEIAMFITGYAFITVVILGIMKLIKWRKKQMIPTTNEQSPQ
jgi:ankyrin repeat protein